MKDYEYIQRLPKYAEKDMTDAQIRQYYSEKTYDLLNKMVDEFEERLKAVRKEAEDIMESSGLRYPILYGSWFESPIYEDIPLPYHADMADFMIDALEIIAEYKYSKKDIYHMYILTPSIYMHPRFEIVEGNIGYSRGEHRRSETYNIDIWNEERKIGRITIRPRDPASKVITLFEKVDDDTVAVIREFTERMPTKEKDIKIEIVEEFNGGA